MSAILFVYSFIWGASYAVGHGHLKTEFPNCKYRFIDRPLSLVITAFWPVMFLIFIVRKFCLPNLKVEPPPSGGRIGLVVGPLPGTEK